MTGEVKCHWYGLKPDKEWLHLRIGSKYQLVRRFSGDVVDNVMSGQRSSRKCLIRSRL